MAESRAAIGGNEPEGAGLDSSQDRQRDEELHRRTQEAETYRRRLRIGRRNSIMDLVKFAQDSPLLLITAGIVVILILSWSRYVYHISYHKYFGKFTEHEKFLCREEPLMLGIQKLMLQKAKREIAYLNHINPENSPLKKRIDKHETLDVEASNDVGPSHPTINPLDHKWHSKIKGLQTKEGTDATSTSDRNKNKRNMKNSKQKPDLHPNTNTKPFHKVFVSNDLGFYQHNYGAVHVEAETGNTLIAQSIGTHSKIGNGFSNMVYYNIWRNAHEYISYLLLQFHQKKRVRDGNEPICKSLHNCQHLDEITSTPKQQLKSILFPSHLRRYPFTFVRNPITRFISGYTEIEYNYRDVKDEHDWWLANKEKKKLREIEEKEKIEKENEDNKTLLEITEKSITGAKTVLEKEKKAREAKIATQLKFAHSKKHSKGNSAQSKLIKGGHKLEAGYDHFGTKQEPDDHLDKQKLPLKEQIGTVERFMEFIDFILLFDGSRRIFNTYDNKHELAHIAPQVGTFFTALRSESLPIRMLKVESFTEEWKTLSEEVRQPRLLQIRSSLKGHENLWTHKSSGDKYNTTASTTAFLENVLQITENDLLEAENSEAMRKEQVAAKEHELLLVRRKLGLADDTDNESATTTTNAARLRETQAKTENVNENENDYAYQLKNTVAETAKPLWLTLPKFRKPEIFYTRALCRIYISDFICANYELPAVCSDILDDVDAFTTEYEVKQKDKVWEHRSIANTIFPEWFLHAIAEIPCMFLSDSPPMCIAKFVYGNDFDEEDHYDEYDSEHDEL